MRQRTFYRHGLLLLLLTLLVLPAAWAGTRVRVGLYQNAPKVARSDTGRPEGIFVDVLEAIAQKEGWSLEYVFGTWGEGLDRLAAGTIDLMPDVAYSQARERLYRFHREPVLSDWFQVYARRGSGIRSLVDLAGKRVAVLDHSMQQEAFANDLKGFDLKVAILPLPDYQNAFSIVASGRADAVIANRFYGGWHRHASGLEDTAIIFYPTKLFFAAPRSGNPALLDAIDRNLAGFKQDPTSIYFHSLQRWAADHTPLHSHFPAWFKSAGIAAVALLLLTLLWSVTLKHQVAARTRELRDSELRYRTLADSGQALIWTAGRDKKCDYFNAPWLRFTGRTLEQEQGDGWTEGVHPDDFQRCVQTYVTAFDRHERFSMEYRLRHASGEYRWLVDDGTPRFDCDGKFLGYIGHCLDITPYKQEEEERKKLQTQLNQAKKMESIGRLAGGVAHDFNNMLAAILGHTELAMDKVDPAQPLFADLREIQKAAEHSADLTRQLLAFARKQTRTPLVIDLNATVEGMFKMLRRLIGEGIEVAWLPGKELGAIKMDPSQLNQILVNLTINARDAIGEVGKLSIATRAATLEEVRRSKDADAVSGDYVALVVSDTGCGMSREVLEHLFEPFFTTKGIDKGTGLGLATVYGILRQNYGFVSVDSEVGHGTTFTLYLPRHHDDPAEAAPPQEPAAATPRGCETVLLVEDEPTILNITTRMLTNLGYTVRPAATADDAIRLATKSDGEIHLLITDVVMPEMNGRDLAQKIQAIRPKTACLFMSGYTSDVIAQHGVLDEDINFIHKPFSKQALAAKIRRVLDKLEPRP